MRTACIFLLLLAAACDPAEPVAEAPTTRPAEPATRPATKPAETEPEVEPLMTYRDVLERDQPAYADVDFDEVRAVNLLDAGIVTFEEPVLLCGRGDLWITREDAPPLAEALDGAAGRATHVIPVEAAFCHWAPGEEGFQPTLIEPTGGDGYRWHRLTGGEVTSLDFELPGAVFANGFSRGDAVLVPTENGAARLSFGDDGVSVDAVDLGGRGHMLLDHLGVLAWGERGTGVMRFTDDGGWQAVEGDWLGELLQVIPMRDGTLTQVYLDADGNVATAGGNFAGDVELDAAEVEAVVMRLADPAPDVRNAAYDELLTYGPGVFPILRELQDRVPVAAKVRLRSLLAERDAPLLGDMQLLPGPVEVVTRQPGPAGGMVMYLPNGVMVPRLLERTPEPYVVPAWVSVRPGHRIERLPTGMTYDVNPNEEQDEIVGWGPEWVVSADSRGPMRWYGNHLRPVLPDEHADASFAGIDSAGRWVFRQDEATLVVDPKLPDVTPRMPTWLVDVRGGGVGRTVAGWPVMRRGGGWALTRDGWSPLDGGAPEDRVLSEPAELADGVIGIGPSGTWHGGGRELRVTAKDGSETTYRLPGEAQGDEAVARVFEIAEPEGRLLLFNSAGQVHRLKIDGEALVLEETFTEGIPNVDRPDDLWLDPAGRLVFTFDGNQLLIAFPSGRVPPSIEAMMPMRDGR